MIKLKRYQEKVLDSLSSYFKLTREVGVSKAFYKQTQRNYITVPQLPGMPYVCLRVPTGGGKTLMSCYTINIALEKLLQSDRGVVLWLVPTNPIHVQTLEALKDKSHPYRKALEQSVGQPINILDLNEALFIQRNTLDNEVCIIVSTLAALRIEDTEGRKIYDNNGHLMSHFTGLPNRVIDSLEKNSHGAINYSLANVLKLRRPIVIMDEAHNARTQLSFETLTRFHPSCIIEYTATPRTVHNPEKQEFASNVLTSVSAAELNAESMIKMPIRLETKIDWKEIIGQAIVKRDYLHRLAKKEERETKEYIRPIVLFQAQPRYQARESIHVDILLKTLIDDFKIPREEIAIATGEHREIEGLDISDQDCKIKFIITVSALKEGWDCPFAYVLSSVADIGSTTAVEQLLGRVLRLPKAKKKNHPELNQAYAFITSPRFFEAASSMEEALINSGFEKFEAKTMISEPEQSTLFDDLFSIVEETTREEPDLTILPEAIKKKVTYDKETKRFTFQGFMTKEEKAELEQCFKTNQSKQIVDSIFHKSNALEQSSKTTKQKAPFLKDDFKVPFLALKQGDLFKIFEETDFIDTSWDLSNYDHRLSRTQFSITTPQSQVGEINVSKKGKIETKFIDDLSEQISLHLDVRNWSIAELTNWIDQRIPHIDITQTQATLFIYRVIEYLIDEREIDLNSLILYKYKLLDAINRLISTHRRSAKKRSYQQCLNLDESRLVVRDEFSFEFSKDSYPANWYYEGRYTFKKHYHQLIGELKSTGEEFECAQVIDAMPEVKYWIRNLERQPQYSFWLQTSTDKFYPDFVAKLKDGRILIVEYKGDHIDTSDDSKEKKALGELWAARSNGTCLFYWATKDSVLNLRNILNE